MNFFYDDMPIIACSTGTSSNTALAVIRLSGFKKLSDLQIFFSFNLEKTITRKSHLTNIIFENKTLDNGLLVFFPEGQSFTNENVLELSVHGNQLNVQRILEVFTKNSNIRHAHPGEFTYRALKNKKLSLSQVEGLDMLLNANSSLMLEQGLDILQGDLHAQYLALYDAYLKLKAAVEISIDFSEDVGAEETQKLFKNSFNRFFELISALKARTAGNISSLLSPEIALVGQTNAGKSSLFNILVNHERSIVSNIAGTTRDYVSEVVFIEGTHFKLVDTAGIRESTDVIENIGIGRAFEILKRSFFKILIINPFETNPEYIKRLSDIDFDLVIFSHSDTAYFAERVGEIDLSFIKTKSFFSASFQDKLSFGPIEPVHLKSKKSALLIGNGPIGPTKLASGSIGPDAKNNGPIGPKNKETGPIEPAKFESGPIEPVGPQNQKSGPIEPLLKTLISNKFSQLTSNNPILLERHRASIDKIYAKSIDFSNNIEHLDDVAILSSEVNILGHSLVELIGIVSPDDVLNSIFANFCIGK